MEHMSNVSPERARGLISTPQPDENDPSWDYVRVTPRDTEMLEAAEDMAFTIGRMKYEYWVRYDELNGDEWRTVNTDPMPWGEAAELAGKLRRDNREDTRFVTVMRHLVGPEEEVEA